MAEYVIHIKSSGLIRHVDVPEGGDTLHFLQGLVGGPIETVPVLLPHPSMNLLMLVNKEGWLDGSADNPTAAMLTNTDHRFGGSFLFGDAVLVKAEGDDFEFFSTTETIEMMALIFEWLNTAGVKTVWGYDA